MINFYNTEISRIEKQVLFQYSEKGFDTLLDNFNRWNIIEFFMLNKGTPYKRQGLMTRHFLIERDIVDRFGKGKD